MDLNEFKGQNGTPVEEDDPSVIVDPNLLPKTKPVVNTDELQKVTPEMLGMPEEKKRGVEDSYNELIENGFAAMQGVADQTNAFKDLAEQNGGEVDGAVHDAALGLGFDPIAMMENPLAMSAKDYKLDAPQQNQVPAEEVPDEEDEHEVSSSEEEDELLADMEAEETVEVKEPKVDNVVKFSADKAVKKAPAAVKPEVVEANEVEIISDDDLDKELAALGADDSEEDDERFEELKADIREKIGTVTKKFDISTFTVTKRPVTISNALRSKENKHTKVGDWGLPASKMHVTMEALLGVDIDTLVDRGSRNTPQSLRNQYNVFYTHILDATKPDTLDAWLKTVSVADVDHLYAAAYRATFSDANFIPYDCEAAGCTNAFVSDSIPFMEMVKFKDDAAKKKFMNIVEGEASPSAGLVVGEMIPVSENFAVVLRDPSIYDAVIRPAYLDNEFREKHRRTNGIAPWISEIYQIDAVNKEINPITIMEYRNNTRKSEMARIITFEKMVNSLTPDEYHMLISYINAINSDNFSDSVKYIMPEASCPKCGEKINESETRMSQLLFLRHQLAALANG